METSGRLTRALNAFAALNYELHASHSRGLCSDTPHPAGAAAGRLSSAATSVSLTVLRLSEKWCGCGPPDAFQIAFLQREQARALHPAASVAVAHCNTARSPLGRVVLLSLVEMKRRDAR